MIPIQDFRISTLAIHTLKPGTAEYALCAADPRFPHLRIDCILTGRAQKSFVNNQEFFYVEVDCLHGIHLVPLETLTCEAATSIY